ncbi:MAG: T9SS type A sorting domain-containing protein [Chitinophagaceae bacterium]|nr:MAG: T9SS type A sorting domain-containing protein [Chitinophagaceae bacterium]
MRKFLTALFTLASAALAGTGYAQTTNVVKTYTTSGTIVFGAGVTNVNVSLWGGGGGGSGGGMTENPGNSPTFWCGGGGGGANWNGGNVVVNAGVPYSYAVGVGGAAGIIDGNGNPQWGGDGTGSAFGGIASYGAFGSKIYGWIGYGGPRALNPVPDPGIGYAADGANGTPQRGGQGGLSNSGPYGPSAAPTFANYSSGSGYPTPFTDYGSSGVPGLRPGDGGGGGGYQTLPHFPVISSRIPGGRGADGVVIFYISYPTYRITQPLTASKLCGPGTPTITLRSSALSTGNYTVTYNTSNPTTTGNTAFMSYNTTAGFGTFSTIPLSNTSTITVTNLASGQTCSDAITVNNTVVVSVQNQSSNDWDANIDLPGSARSNAVSFVIDNKAYVGTGKNGTTYLSDFWQFNQATNTWTQIASFGGGVRADAIGMAIGTKGYVGTGTDGTSNKSDFWEYDPYTNVWRTRASFGGGLRSGAAAFSFSDFGFVGTGVNGGTYYSDLWRYNPRTDSWTSKAAFPGPARSGATGVAISSRGYFAMGSNGSTLYNTLYEYHSANDSWQQRTSFPGAARSGAAAFAIGNFGYFGTGWNGTAGTNDFYAYDWLNNSWAAKATFIGTARQNAVAYAIGSKGYFATGLSGATALKDIYEYSQSSTSVVTAPLSATSFCVGASFTVSYTSGCVAFNPGNYFIAELSDSTGSWNTTYGLGLGFAANGSITATIPSYVPAGSKYRVRVVASDPLTIGTDNGADIAIKPSVTTPVVATISQNSICRDLPVQLTASVATAATSDTTVLLSENFNTGTTSWLLLWNSSYPIDAGIAEIFADGQRGAHSNDNTSFFGSISSGRNSTDVTNMSLQSPAFSTLGVNSASLTFYHHYQYGGYNNSDSIRIQASTDNGVTWTTVFLNNSVTVGDPQDSLGFVKQTVSLNNFVNNPSVVLRFNYGAYGGMGRWYFDNIVLKGVSRSNNYSWTSNPAGFTSTQQNPVNVIPATAPGTTTYTVAFTNNYGCGTVSNSVSVYVKDTSSSTSTLSICSSALPFQWNGLTFNGAGTQIAHLVNAAGCDSAAKLVLVVRPNSTSTTNISICPPELPYTWNGLVFTTAGAQTAHFTNSVGCDSAATLNLTVKRPSNFTQNLTICESALPYTWNGATLTASGSTTVHFSNAVGCDSAVTLHLLTTPSVTSATATATSVCPGAVISLSAAASSGATVTVLNEGFNSTHNDWTKINLSSGGLADSAAWMLRPYNYEIFNGVVGMTSNDNSQFYLTNSFAQGTNVTTHTILQSPVFSTVGLTTATMNFYHQFTHQTNFANDSIRVQISEDGSNWTNLYVNKNTTVGFNSQFQQQTISLNSYLNKPALRLRFVYNGTPMPGGYTNYWWAIDNVTVTGTIAASTFAWTSVPAGFTSSLQNPPAFTPTQNTTYNVAVSNGYCSAGRSVMVTMNSSNPSSVTNLAMCPSSLPYVWNGLTFNGAGTQTKVIHTAGNCDSSATLNLTITPQASSVTNLTICPSGLPYTWNGLVFTAAGSKTKLFATGAACDSAATLNLTVQTSSTSSNNSLTICDNQLPYTWNGQVFAAAGSKVATLTNSFGCDSVVTMFLFVSNTPTGVTASSTVNDICPGASTNLNSSAALVAATIFDETFNNGATGWTTQSNNTGGTPANGAWTLRADGYVYTELSQTFHSNDNSTFYLANSRSQGIGSSTDTYLQSPVFSTVGYNTASLTFYHHYVSNNNDSIRIQISTDYGTTWTRLYSRNIALQGNSSNFQLQTISLNGYVNQPGLRLRFNYGATYDYYWSLDNVKITGTMAPLSYSWTSLPAGYTSSLQNPTGVMPSQPTTYTVAATSAAGCRSTASISIAVKSTSTSTTSLAICPTSLPFVWNGLTFPSAGTQTAHLTNSVGCDSAATLVLTVKAATASSATTSVCPGSFPYTWNGVVFNSAGSQVVHYTNAAGCDSAATLIVTMKPASTSTSSQTICSGALPYSWNGLTFTAAGSQTAHLLNSVGCDSAATLTLAVNAAPGSVTAAASSTSICAGSSINLTSSSTGSGAPVTVFSENFNAATNNWTKTNTTTGGNATASAWTLWPAGSGLQSNDNSQYMMSLNVNLDYGGVTHTTLQSPTFSTVGLSNASLSFYHAYSHNPYAWDSIRVQVSVNGSSWSTVYLNNSTSVGAQNNFVLQTISLNAYLNQPNLRIRFDYNAAWYSDWWGIDNVKVTGQPTNTYSWTSSPAGFASNTQNPTGVAPTETTTYTVTALNASGCTSSQSVQVTVNPAPSATINYGFTSNCVTGGTATVFQTGTPGGIYSAPAGLALNSSNGAVSLPASTPGTYTVTYTIPAQGFCPSFATTGSITIDPTYSIAASAGPNGTISPAGTTTLCSGNTVSYSITPGPCSVIADVLVDGRSMGPISSYSFNDLAANHTISASFTVQAAVPTVVAGGGTTICSGGSVLLTSSPGATYQWLLDDGPISGANAQSFTATAAGTYTVFVTNGPGCSGTSTPTVVQNNIVASISYPGSPYCISTGTAPVFFSGSNGGSFSATPAGLVLDASTGAIDLAASANGNYVVSYAPAAGSCGAVATAAVSIRPGSLIDAQPNVVLCAGTTSAPIHLTGAAGSAFTWSSSNPAIGVAATGAGDVPSFVAQNNGTQSVESNIFVIASGGTGCTAEKPMVFRITVMPAPSISAVANQTLCAGFATAAINFSGPDATTVYTWINNNPSIGLIPAGTGSIAPFIAVNNSGSTQVASIRVVPVANHCSGAPLTFTISVAPSAGSISYPQASYCPKSWAYATRTGSAGGTFTATPAGLAIESANGAVNLAASLAGTYTVTYTTASAGAGCANNTSTQITILPTATVNAVPNVVLCNGAVAQAVAFSGGTTYGWVNTNPSIGLAPSGSGTTLPAFIAVNTSNVPVYAYITVTALAGPGTGCPGRSLVFRITVNPTPVINAVAAQAGLCRGMLTAPVAFAGNGVAGTTYAWTNSDVRLGLAGRGTGNIGSFIAQNPTPSTLTSTVTVTAAANKCYSTPMTFIYSVGNCLTQAAPSGDDGSTARQATGLDVRVSPNPVQDRLTVTVTPAPEGAWTVKLVSVDGTPMLRPRTATGAQTTLSTAGVTPGMYVLRVETAKGEVLQKQVVKL